MNSSCILGRKIFFTFYLSLFFIFGTQWSWAGQELSQALYGVHQTSGSSSVDYDNSGFHSGGLSKTGDFTHR